MLPEELSWMQDEHLARSVAASHEIAARHVLFAEVRRFVEYAGCEFTDRRSVALRSFPRKALVTLRPSADVALSVMRADDRATLAYLNKVLAVFLREGIALELPPVLIEELARFAVHRAAESSLQSIHAKRSRPKAAA